MSDSVSIIVQNRDGDWIERGHTTLNGSEWSVEVGNGATVTISPGEDTGHFDIHIGAHSIPARDDEDVDGHLLGDRGLTVTNLTDDNLPFSMGTLQIRLRGSETQSYTDLANGSDGWVEEGVPPARSDGGE